MREKQERLEKSEEFRIKQLHFADNEGIMSEEIGSDESYDRKAVYTCHRLSETALRS